MDWRERSQRLLGEEAIEKLNRSHVLICGLGGVGSFAAEALVRSGIGHLFLLDFDKIGMTNINRQLPANMGTLGRYKTDVLEQRFLQINPNLEIINLKTKLTTENMDDLFDNSHFSYIADAIDDLPAKVQLLKTAFDRHVPIISSMGAAYRMDPGHLRIDDLSKTHTCPLARKVRRMLKDEQITMGIPVVWSDEPAIEPQSSGEGPASMIFVPASAGLMMASYIVRQLCQRS